MDEPNHGLVEQAAEFLSNYYREELAKIAQSRVENPAVWVDYSDIVAFNPDLADDLRDKPEMVLEHLDVAIQEVDLPSTVNLENINVRVEGINEEHIYEPGETRKEQGGSFIGISGILERVTSTSDLLEVAEFECQRCGTMTQIPQNSADSNLQEPHECSGCERQGPFKIDGNQSEWSDYAKIRIAAKPDSDHDGKLTGFVKNDLLDSGGETGLLERNGEPVTVNGILRRVQNTGQNANESLFDHHLEVNSVTFDRDSETVSIEDHKDEFEELSTKPDAVDLFAQSIAPHLHATDAWDAAFEFAVAYLFGAPRIDIDNGPTYRGDLHFLIVSDYGMGKSDFSDDIAEYSPKCIKKSTTALSSDVGLTAAAVKDDFGDGQWTIKPGLLVRANGGHLILDEIDKGPEELTNMNDALEGRQTVDVEKAGQSVTYESRTGLMALGNPVEGRFDPNMKVSEQLGISESLLSRFDGIVTMEDRIDEEQDANVAESYGRSYTEAQANQYGEQDSFDYLDRPVPVDVGQAWIKYARENVNPLLEYEQFEELKEWYAEDVRQLNRSFAGSGEGEDMPVPATVRVLGAVTKMAIAFARVHLREKVIDEDVKRAKKLGKRLVKQNWNGETFDVAKEHTGSMDSRRKRLVSYVRDNPESSVSEIAQSLETSEDVIESDIEKLCKRQGVLFEPETGKYSVA